jgi:hypothetical protein
MGDKHVKAKAEFLGPREGNTLKADFQGSDLVTVRRKAGLNTQTYVPIYHYVLL